MLQQSLSVDGVLVDSQVGVGPGELSVELWSLDESAPGPLDKGPCDVQGRFTLNLPIGPELKVEGDRVRLEFRVFDHGNLILAEIRECVLDQGPQTIRLLVPDTAAGSRIRQVAERQPEIHQVRGGIRGPCEYALLEERLDTEVEAGAGTLDGLSAEALFELADDVDVEPERLALLQRVRALEAETGLSGQLFYALGQSGMSLELAELIDFPRSELKSTVLAAVDDEIVDESVLQDLDSALARLSQLVVERVIEADRPTMRGGLGEILAVADLPSEVLRDVLGRYQARPAGVAEFWEGLLEGDAEQEAVGEEVSAALELAVDLGALLGSDATLVRRMLELHTQGRWQDLQDLAEYDFDDWCELLESLDVAEAAEYVEADHPSLQGASQWVDEGTESDLGQQVLDGDLTEYEAGISSLEGMDEDESSGETELVDADSGWYEDASEFDTESWYEDDYAPDELDDDFDDAELEEDGYAEFIPGTTVEDDSDSTLEEEPTWIEIRAEAILDTLEEAFPSVFIRRELLQDEELSEGTRQLLERLPRHDFLNASIRELTTQHAELLAGLEADASEAAIEEVEAIERVSRVTQHAEEVAVLVGTGMNSAQAIAAQPRRHFIDLYSEALGGRAQAARVHAQAQQTASASTLAMVRLLQALQQTPLVLGGSVALAQAARDKALKDIPDARTLFGSIGLCGCEHCRSVYSPAAYFVDLLRYLDIRDPERLKQAQERLRKRGYPVQAIRNLSRYRPLDVLLARRPDLAEIPLSCENTLTPLPYIDLVNELLEARISERSAAHDTGSTPADVLKAVPQFIDRDAYERLREAVYPASLPFHEPLAVARAYLGHLGVARRDLLKTLARGEARDAALVAEALGMSPEEFAIVSRPPEPLWRHFGFDSEQVGGVNYVQALMHGPTFLAATGIGFQELIDLVSTRFINAEDRIKLESPSPDCDPAKVRISGLDQAHLSRMIRLLRLRRHLGFSLNDLDRALFALAAKDLDPPILQKLVEVRDLSKQLDRPIVELLGLWASLDTFGKDNLFERLLRTRAVTWRTQDADTFKLQDNRLELAHTADSLDEVAPALLAAFRLTSEELALARALHARLSGKPPRRDLAGLSAVYRVAFLARALKLRIDQLDALLRLVPADANPFRAAEPAATRRFVEIVRQVQASSFSPAQLVYLYHPIESPRAYTGPTTAQVQAVLEGIRRGLLEAYSETQRPAELTGDFLRRKLGMYLDAALVDPAMEALDPRTRLTTEKRHQFFDRHLAGIFPDGEAAKQALFSATASSSSPAAGTTPTKPATEAAAEATSGGQAGTTPLASPTSSAPAAPSSAAGQRWRANIERVVGHLLPILRTRRMRGAVVRALSESLGTSSISTGRLLDGALHSRRRAGRALLEDFQALLGTGLTGHYFSNAELQGEPLLIRTDPKLEFSWAGAAPATGIPGSGFSIRWSGRLLPRAKAPHTFFVSSDGGVRLSIKVGAEEQLLLDQTGAGGGIVESVSRAVSLDPARLYEFKIEYRNQGPAASLALQYGTSPDSKQPIPTANLFPVDGLSSFAPVALSYRRLHKAALLLTGFGISDEQLAWLIGEPRYLDLDKLPMESAEQEATIASFQRWRQLAALYALRKKLPSSNTDLFAVFRSATLAEAIKTLVKASGWDQTVVEAFLGKQGFAIDQSGLGLPMEPAREPFLLRLAQAIDIQHRVGVSPETLFTWAEGAPDADIAAAVVQAVKARYDEKRWLEVARGLNDPLRLARREALVAYLLPRLREQGVNNRNQLFEYFLIDVEMNPCMLTSRIKQAISAVQTFFQRCLMNLEKHVPPRLIDQGDWKWLKNYRVWEANRKVFLYPENWIEPELRDDKSPEFKTLERTILQQEIKKENVESAFIDYLQRLDEISRLDVRGVWFERRQPGTRRRSRVKGRIPPPGAKWQEGTYHIFARTYNAPHVWFYRRLEKGRVWTPWEKIDTDIEGDHLVPVMFQNRLHLFWTLFREKSKPTPKMKKDAAPFTLGKDWEISLAYSVYDRGRWTRKQLSSGNVIDRIELVFLADFAKMKKGQMPRVEGSAWLPASAYTLRAAVRNVRGRLTVYLYRRAVDRLQAARSASTG
ncbi:MAG: neuraminidase-like domain-containing protein, partial [Chromatiales bacterium]